MAAHSAGFSQRRKLEGRGVCVVAKLAVMTVPV